MADPTNPSKPPDSANANPDISVLTEKLRLDNEKKINDVLEEQKKKLKDIVTEAEKITNASEAVEQVEKETAKTLKDKAKSYTDIDEKINNIKENYDQIVDAEQLLQEAEDERAQKLQENYKLNQKNYLLLLEQIKVETDEGRKKLLEKQREVLLAQIKSQANSLEQNEKEKKLKQDILNIGKQILQQSLQYGEQLEKHIIQISQLNGGYDKYTNSLREANNLMYASSVGTGLRIEELNEALVGLSKNFIGLTTQTAGSIKDMGTAVAQLGKLGVDAATASKSFDSLVTAMGKTPQQAVKIQDSFVQMAAKNRLALGSVTQAFAENSNRFVGYGEQMTKVLDGLAEQSLKTGIAIGKLVGIAQGFDTFEDASRKVGNLNALLGGDYFNSIELLTASDEDRIRLLKEGVAASGMQWESMNRFQKMAIANAAGITDMNEAAKLFGETSLQNTRQQAEGAEVQKTLAEQAESATLAMDKLKSSFNGLILILEPIVTVLMKFVGVISDIVQGINNKLSKVMGPTWGAITTSFLLYGLYTIIRLKAGFGGLIKTIGTGIVNAVTRASAAIKGMPTPAAGPVASAGPTSAVGGGMFSNAGNMIKAAAGMLIFAAAMFVMAKALQEFTIAAQNDKTGGGLGYAAAALIGLSVAALILSNSASEVIKGSVVVLIMAASLLLLGIAVQSFSKINWSVLGIIAAVLIGLSVALVLLGLAVSGPQGLLLLAGIGVMLAMSVALLALGAALTVVSLAISIGALSISKLVDSFKQLFEIKDLKDNFSSIESFLSQLSDIDYDPINNLANAVGLLAENLQKLASVSTNLNIKGNVQTTTTQNIQTLANQAGESAVAVGETASKRMQQSLIPAQQTTAFVPVVVQINGKNIIDILRRDIEIVSGEETRRMLESVGIVQSSDYIQASPVIIEEIE